MKLGTVEVTGRVRRVVGMAPDGKLVDLARLSEALEIGPYGFPRDMLDLLAAGQLRTPFLDLCERAILAGHGEEFSYDPSDVVMKSPVPRPTKVVCINSNRPNSKVDLLEPKWGGKWPRPQFFMKMPTAVVGHGEPVVIEEGMGRIQPEGELCLIIGRRAKRLSPENALDCVAGVSLINDLSCSTFGLQDGVVLHIQGKDGAVEDFINRPMARAKGVDTFSPIGPWIVPMSDIGDVGDIRLTMTLRPVDGPPLLMQDGLIRDQRYTPGECLACISEWVTLEPGDAIALGAVAVPPGRYLREVNLAENDGGSIDIEATGVGLLSSPLRVVARQRETEAVLA